jgi:hypothetical protein
MKGWGMAHRFCWDFWSFHGGIDKIRGFRARSAVQCDTIISEDFSASLFRNEDGGSTNYIVSIIWRRGAA